MKDNKFTPSDKGANGKKLPPKNSTRKTPRPSTDRPIKINDVIAHEILKRLPNHNTQYATFAKILIKRCELLTGKANPMSGVNLSNIANKLINPRIKDLGLVVDCRTPEKRIINQHGNISGQKYWGFYNL